MYLVALEYSSTFDCVMLSCHQSLLKNDSYWGWEASPHFAIFKWIPPKGAHSLPQSAGSEALSYTTLYLCKLTGLWVSARVLAQGIKLLPPPISHLSFLCSFASKSLQLLQTNAVVLSFLSSICSWILPGLLRTKCKAQKPSLHTQKLKVSWHKGIDRDYSRLG